MPLLRAALPLPTLESQGWNILDGTIALTGAVGLIPALSRKGGTSLSVLRAARTLRALRPLRMATRLPGMRVVIDALTAAVPGIGNGASPSPLDARSSRTGRTALQDTCHGGLASPAHATSRCCISALHVHSVQAIQAIQAVQAI